jgi:hypothetical protein
MTRLRRGCTGFARGGSVDFLPMTGGGSDGVAGSMTGGGGIGMNGDGDRVSTNSDGGGEGVFDGVWEEVFRGARERFLKWLGIRCEDMVARADVCFRRRVFATPAGSGAGAHSLTIWSISSLSKTSFLTADEGARGGEVVGASLSCLSFAGKSSISATCDGGGTGDAECIRETIPSTTAANEVRPALGGVANT